MIWFVQITRHCACAQGGKKLKATTGDGCYDFQFNVFKRCSKQDCMFFDVFLDARKKSRVSGPPLCCSLCCKVLRTTVQESEPVCPSASDRWPISILRSTSSNVQRIMMGSDAIVCLIRDRLCMSTLFRHPHSRSTCCSCCLWGSPPYRAIFNLLQRVEGLDAKPVFFFATLKPQHPGRAAGKAAREATAMSTSTALSWCWALWRRQGGSRPCPEHASC